MDLHMQRGDSTMNEHIQLQLQWLAEEINDQLLYDDEEAFTFFDIRDIICDIGMESSVNIGRDLMEDRAEQLTSALTQSLGRHIDLDDCRGVITRSVNRGE